MVMNWITHKSGRQPAWETGEIGHLISSALTEMPEKGGPNKPAPPSSWSRGFCIWEMIHWSQLKPSFFPITQQKDSKQLQASLKKAHDNCQTWFWLVMLPDSRRDNGWKTSLARPGIYKHICLYSQSSRPVPPPEFRGSEIFIFSSKTVRRSTHHAPSPSIPFETDSWRTLLLPGQRLLEKQHIETAGLTGLDVVTKFSG